MGLITENGYSVGTLAAHGRLVERSRTEFSQVLESSLHATRDLRCLNAPGRWKGNVPGKGINYKKEEGSPEF